MSTLAHLKEIEINQSAALASTRKAIKALEKEGRGVSKKNTSHVAAHMSKIRVKKYNKNKAA